MGRRIPKEFVPLDLNLPSDAAIRRAGPDAELLYIRGLIYLKRTGSDGFIPAYDLPALAVGLRNVKTAATALVRVQLWVDDERDDEPGWLCRSWLKWNMSQQEIAESRADKKLRALKTHHSKGLHTNPVTGCPNCEASA